MATLSQTSFQAFIKRHPVLTYYALTFAISWGGILLVIGGPGSIPGTPEQISRLFVPYAVLVLFAGPSISGIVMNGLVDGKAGLRRYIRQLLNWRVGARWYAIALLTGPLLVKVVSLALSLFSPQFLPAIVTTDNKAGLLLFGLSWGLIGGGLLEETGWTGFVIPHLRQRCSAVQTGMIAGTLWGIWHLLIAVWAGGSLSGGHWTTYLLAIASFYLGVLPAYRILMVWMYDRIQSLPLAMLMHAIFSASTFIIQPALTGIPFLIFDLGLTAAVWVVVAAVAVAKGGKLSRGENTRATGLQV